MQIDDYGMREGVVLFSSKKLESRGASAGKSARWTKFAAATKQTKKQAIWTEIAKD